MAAAYLRQGRQVLIVGEMKPIRIYTNRQGEPAATLEVTAHTIQFLGGEPEDDEALVQARLLEHAEFPF